jgi:hypothetical protein
MRGKRESVGYWEEEEQRIFIHTITQAHRQTHRHTYTHTYIYIHLYVYIYRNTIMNPTKQCLKRERERESS